MDALRQGLVISHFGKGIAVESDNRLYLCQTLRKLDSIAVGDQVEFMPTGHDQGRIEKLLPRRSVLKRPGRGGGTRPVAANIDNVFIVCAVEPACDFLLIDQYLAICENNQLNAALILNKIDLSGVDSLARELMEYQSLGYPLHQVSASRHIGIAELTRSLNNHVNIFTGQSGVGKSSLTSLLLPDKDIKTNTVSATTRHGRHTTTAATLYHLPEGGDLIDSPGVAIFGLAELDARQLAWGYREFQPLLTQCKYHNCRHELDQGCAVRRAAENQDISMPRYQRYRKLCQKLPKR